MTLTTKVFTLLVFLLACLLTSVTAVKFSERVHWPKKMQTKIGDMITQEKSYKEEIKAIEAEKEQIKQAIAALDQEIGLLKQQERNKDSEIATLYQKLDKLTIEFNRINSDIEVLLQQLHLERDTLRNAINKVEELRTRLTQAISEKNAALYKAIFFTQENEALQKYLAAVEEKFIIELRKSKDLINRVDYMIKKYGPEKPPVNKPVETLVKSAEPGGKILLIGAGKDDGIQPEDLIIITRGTLPIAHATVVQRADKFSTCYIIKLFDEKVYPQAGDMALRKAPGGK